MPQNHAPRKDDPFGSCGEGAPCLWRLAEECLPPGTVFIQDFWHVCEHLGHAAQAVWRNENLAEENASRWRSMLAESRIGEIIEELRGECRRLRGERRKKLKSEIAYLESGRHRMDYTRYRSEGWVVGSGAVEGTCKHLVKERYNVTVARWSREKIPLILALRLSLFNKEWYTDWETLRQAA